MSQLYETSEAIVAGINKGDRKAEAAMVQKYGRALIFILEKRTGDPEHAKDLQQETFLIVLQKLRKEPLSSPEKLAAYLQNTAINLHIGELRKEIRRNTFSDSETISLIADTKDDQFDELAKIQSKRAVKRLISELKNNRDRKILELYYIQDSNKSDVCEELGLSPRHFDRVISRARSRFRALLESHDEELRMEST